jgi:hypothetical protein
MEEKDEREEPQTQNRWGTFLAGSFLLILYMSFFAVMLGISFTRKIPSVHTENETINLTPTIVPTPQILFNLPDEPIQIKFENFTSNFRDWSLYYRFGKVEIINEKMIIQSNIEDFAIVSNENFIKTSDTYYIQAELVTDNKVDYQQYGLIFGLNRSDSSFYLYEINPEYNFFRLYKFAPTSDYQVSRSSKQAQYDWILLIDYTKANMNRYPNVNILGVFFKKGSIELFINGDQVATYLDEKPLHSSGVGVFVNNYGYRLIVDNFFGYSE